MEKKAFTLVEILVYAAILGVILTGLAGMFSWASSIRTKTEALTETSSEAAKVMERMSFEIRQAESINFTQSVFDSDNGRLSLQTKNYSQTEEILDFYLCSAKLCFKKGVDDPVFLTSDNLEISVLRFSRLGSDNNPSLEISLNLAFKNPQNRSEKKALVDLKSAVSLRAY